LFPRSRHSSKSEGQLFGWPSDLPGSFLVNERHQQISLDRNEI
jgi:hypothetical protein